MSIKQATYVTTSSADRFRNSGRYYGLLFLWAILSSAVFSNCAPFDLNENCLNPQASCFTAQTVAPYVVSYVPIPNRGSNAVSKLTGIQVTFSQRVKGWLNPEKYQLTNFGNLQISSIEQTGTYTVTLNLSGKLANGNVDLSFPRLTNFTGLPFANGASIRLVANLDIGVSILDSQQTYFVSSAGGTGKANAVIHWSHDYQLDAQNNNSYTLKVGGATCADATPLSSGTNISGVNLSGNTQVTSTIPVGGNFAAPGIYFVRICVINDSGFNKSGEALAIIIHDNTAPSLKATLGSGAYGEAQSIRFSCHDNCSQLAYNLSTGSTPQSAPATPVFAGDGSLSNGNLFTGMWITPYSGSTTYSTISVVAIDNAGNQSAPLILSYQINPSLPVITLASPVATREFVSGGSGYDTSTITWRANQSGSYQVCLGGTGCTVGPGCGGGTPISSSQAYSSGSSVSTNILAIGSPALAIGNNSVHICLSNGVQVADANVSIYRSDVAPTVVQVSPGDLANAIPSTAPVVLHFASPIALDLATVSTNTQDGSCSGTFQISSAADNFASNACIQMSAQPIALSSQTFLITAASDFSPGIYKVRVSSALKDNAGNALASAYTLNTGFAVSGLMRQFTFNNDSTDLENRAFTGFPLSVSGTLAKVTGVDGDASGAYRFDGSGNSFLSGLDSNLPLGQGPRTVCAWLNPMAQCGTNCVAAMYGSSGGAYLGNRGASTGYGFPAISDSVGTTTLKLNTWVHTCHVYDGNTLKVYLNGIQDGTATATATTALGSGIFIGKPSSATGQAGFYGRIDDVRIYAGALPDLLIRQMAIQVPTGLELYYSFSDAVSQTATDFSNNGHKGILTGNPSATADRFGNTGSYNFTASNQWITATDAGLPAGSKARTVCTWVMPTALPASGSYASAARYGNPSASQAQVIGLYNDGTATKIFYGAWGDDVMADYPIVLNTWLHICGTYDGKNAAIYVNGAQLTSQSKIWNTVLTGAGGVFIGQGDASGTSAFSGRIDDFRVHNRVLAQHEITALSLQLSAGLLRQYSFLNGQVSEDNGGPALVAVGNPTVGIGSDGSANSAFAFNGSSQYLSGNDSNLPASNATRTFCARVNPVNVGLSAFALSYGSTIAGENSFLYTGGSSGVTFGNLANNLTAPTTLPANTWSNLCGVLEADGKATVYLNGNVPTGGGPIVKNFNTVLNGQFAVGARSDSAFRWAGKLDDIRIYSRALSPIEIKELEGY